MTIRRWAAAILVLLACTCASSEAVVLVEFDFEQAAAGNTPVSNSGVGPDGRLLNGATVADGVLNIDGVGSGLDIPLGALNPFGGTSDWTVQFDFASIDEGGGPLFSSDSSVCVEECNDDVAAGSLNIFLTDEGEVVVDAWFIGAIGGGFGLNDGETHTVRVDYTAEEGLWELFVNDEEEPVEEANWPYERNATVDRSRIGDQTNPDFGFEDIDPGEDGIVATIDNFRIDAPSPPPLVATIDRATGAIRLTSIKEDPLQFSSLSIQSPSGSLDPDQWTSIAGNYDAAGDGSVDPNDTWTRSNDSSAEELRESQQGGDGGVLQPDQSFTVGNVWLASPLEDIRVELFDVDLGETIRSAVAFEGDSLVFGDLNADGNLNGDDWELFVGAFGRPLEGLSGRDRYFLADLNGDGFHDADDFIEFSIAYDAVHGAGAFGALAAVPEPHGCWLLGLAGMGWLRCRRSRRSASSAPPRRQGRRVGVSLILAVSLAGTIAGTAKADLLAEYLFNSDTADSSGNNRKGTLDTGIFGEGQPAVRNGKLVLTGSPGEGMEIPLGDANPFDGSQNFTIDLSFNVGINDDETGYLLISSADENDAALPDNHSMSVYLDGEGSIVYDNFFVGEVRVEAQDYRDEQEHQLRITYDAPAEQGDDGQMFIRVDGEWLGSGEIQPVVPDIENHAVYLGTSLNEEFPFECEEFCAVQDLLGTMDEVRIWDESLAPTQMRVEVNRANGDIMLVGGEFVRDVQYYEINSPSGSLDANAWTTSSLDAQNVDATGDGSGQSWDLLTASEQRVVEAFLLGSTEFDPERAVTIAGGWRGEEDLEVQIVTTDREVLSIEDVSYFGEVGNALDCNGDGVVSAADFDCSNQAGTTADLIADLGLLEGDLNGDREVDFADFLVLSNNFSQTASYSGGDISGNGTVDFADFLVLSANFGQTPQGSLASVPEPTCSMLACWGFALGLLRRRSRCA